MGQIGPEATAALSASLGAYVAEFGALPPKMQAVADQLGLTYDPITQSFVEGGNQVAGGIATSAETQRQAVANLNQQLVDILGPAAAEPIRQMILAAYNAQAGAHTEGNATAAGAASEGGQAAAIQSVNQQLMTLLGESAGPIIAQINAAYNAQAGAHTQGGQTVGTASTNAGNQALTAQGGATATVAGKLEADRVALANRTAAFYAAQQEQHLFGGGNVGSAIAAAADAQNETQKSATGAISSYLATVQGGLLKDIAGHATDEAGIFTKGGSNVQRAFADTQNAKAKLLQIGTGKYVSFLSGVADSVYNAARAVYDSEAAGLTGQGQPGKKGFLSGGAFKSPAQWKDIIAGGQLRGNYETIPDRGMGSYEPPDPNETKVSKPKKGSINYANDELSELEERYANETDPKERRRLAALIKRKRKARDNLDFLRDDGPKAKPGKGGGGGSGGGSGYSPADDPTIRNSPAWIREQIRKIETQIDKTTSPGKIRELQKKREKFQAQLDALLGNEAPAVDRPAVKGSIDYLQEQIQKEQAKFDSATTDKARSASAERLRVLKDELEAKQAILRDAEKEIDKTLGSSVITIESPLADLSSITVLAKTLDEARDSLVSLPLGDFGKGVSTQLGRAGSISSAKGTLSMPPISTTLPAYEQQRMDAFTARFDGSTVRFDNATVRFDRTVARLEARLSGSQRPHDTSTLTDKARGQSLSVFGLQR